MKASRSGGVNGFAVTQEQRGEEELVTCYEIRTGDFCWANSVHANRVEFDNPGTTETPLQGVQLSCKLAAFNEDSSKLCHGPFDGNVTQMETN